MYLPTNPLETFLKTVLLDESFANSIIITSGLFLEFAIAALLKMEIDLPSNQKHRKKNTIYSFNLPWNNVRLTNIQNYAGNWEKFVENEEIHFFPLHLNHKGTIIME